MQIGNTVNKCLLLVHPIPVYISCAAVLVCKFYVQAEQLEGLQKLSDLEVRLGLGLGLKLSVLEVLATK